MIKNWSWIAGSLLVLAAVGSLSLAVGCSMGCHHHEEGTSATTGHADHQGTAATVAVVNSKCPIMGGKIDPAKVPADLTREYKGQKVGFCCAGCPATWDKLTDAEKDAKLAAAMK